MSDSAPAATPVPAKAPAPAPAAASPAAASPGEDPNATPAATAMPPASPPGPTVEEHEPTGTALLHYRAANLDAALVTQYARAAGYDVIAAPDQLAPDHWRVQVSSAETKEN